MVAKPSLESFSHTPGAGQDASHTLVAAAYEGLDPGVAGLGRTPESVRSQTGSLVSDAAIMPTAMDGAASAQITRMIADGKKVQFTAAADLPAGTKPDFILKDGKLIPTGNPPSPDGKVNIAVEGSDPQSARQTAQSMQNAVAAVQEKIAYWKRSHTNPNEDVPDFLKGELAAAQTSGPSMADTRAAYDGLKYPDAPQQPGAQVPDAGNQTVEDGGVGGGVRGGGDGGGGYRPASDYHGVDSPGAGPRGGYTDGQFDPDAQINPSVIPQPVAGDMSILVDPVKGPSATVEQIQKFLEDAHSPAAREIDPTNGKSFAQNLYDACMNRETKLDPGACVGFFLEESSLGTKGRAVANHSFGNIKGTSPESHQTDGTFRRYASFSESVRDWANLIDHNYVHKRGLTTLSQILSVYAPSSDGNNVHGYVATVKGVAENFRREKDTTAMV